MGGWVGGGKSNQKEQNISVLVEWMDKIAVAQANIYISNGFSEKLKLKIDSHFI